MPEIFRSEKKCGFISIWCVEESVDFFRPTIKPETFDLFQNRYENENRVKEKLVPHYVLKNFNPSIVLDNTGRKPLTSNGFVSVSHCKNYVATAWYNDTPVGIDIEHYGDRILKIRHKFMDEHERNFCGDDSIKCLMVWAAKEALFKKYGGSTVFFAENIHLQEPLAIRQQELSAEIYFENACVKENLFCELLEEFVLVHTL